MDLDEQWVNDEPQGILSNGKEIITTKSTLLCKRGGLDIWAVTSGQDGIGAAKLIEEAIFRLEMEKKYPGLLDILQDPNGSLYLNEGMYEVALQFLDDYLEKHGGEIEFISQYQTDMDVEAKLAKTALSYLMSCLDMSAPDKLTNSVSHEGSILYMEDVPGWNPQLLNAAMMEMIREDCAQRAKAIATDDTARWNEENRQRLQMTSDAAMDLIFDGLMVFYTIPKADEAAYKRELAGKKVRKVNNKGGTDVLEDIITDGSHLENGQLKPNITYKTGENGYIYTTNENELIIRASTDNLQFKTHEGRLGYNPNTYGKEAGDHAGHLFGDRFGGSPELDNLVSQAKRVNLSEYKVIENQWARALENGQKVTVDISINYDVGGIRPISFDVSYTIDDVQYYQKIYSY